jgi:hypothetical protein
MIRPVGHQEFPPMKSFCQAALVALGLALLAPCTMASDETLLKEMLQEFLANADKAPAHEKFWAEDLVYSSSSGLRFGKADIMQGFDDVDAAEAGPPAVVYSGEEVDVRLYDDMAVVAFRLIGTPADGSERLHYYNTGTFLKRDGVWKVVAWQATKIPPASDGSQ